MASQDASVALAMPLKSKLHGRAFYESLGSPKVVLAPMVDQSELAWRLLTRSFVSPDSTSSTTAKPLLAYTPMLHARLFKETAKYRDTHFEAVKQPAARGPQKPSEQSTSSESVSAPHLDGNPKFDRPLFVQFCANGPEAFLGAAHNVAPYCDAVDLNLGCPQGIAKKGHYGAFLQEDKPLIFKLINILHKNLDVPVTAKMRILETKEDTLAYAKMILEAGASIITVHGRRREQKGHITGLADWEMLKYLRDSLPGDTVIFANGNILQHEDIEECLKATGADGVMSAEGNLHDPTIFAAPPAEDQKVPGYWRGRDGKGGYRMDYVLRQYLDIIYRYVLDQDPPNRLPLSMGLHKQDSKAIESKTENSPNEMNGKRPLGDIDEHTKNGEGPLPKKAKKEKRAKRDRPTSPNLLAMQPHLFHMLRPLIAKHTHVRDALAQSRAGDMDAFENVLRLTETVTAEALAAYNAGDGEVCKHAAKDQERLENEVNRPHDKKSGEPTSIQRCWRPWWVCQPYVRPLPAEALEKGSIQLSKKQQDAMRHDDELTKDAGLKPEGKLAQEPAFDKNEKDKAVPRDGMVCG